MGKTEDTAPMFTAIREGCTTDASRACVDLAEMMMERGTEKASTECRGYLKEARAIEANIASTQLRDLTKKLERRRKREASSGKMRRGELAVVGGQA